MNTRLFILCGFYPLLVFVALSNIALANDHAYKDNACISCHRDLPGKLSAVVEDWKQSVHCRNNVTCDGCHGGDPSIRRDLCDSEKVFKERSHLQRDREFFLMQRSKEPFTSTARGRGVSYYCGKCHSTIKEKHLGSPHGDLGNPTCLYCHGMGSHAIQNASPQIIDSRPLSEGGRCAVCHQAATMVTVSNIREILINAELQLKNAAELRDWLEHHGYKNLEMSKMHHRSRDALSQLRQTFHSFNMREIDEVASSIKTDMELTQETYNIIKSLEITKTHQAAIGIAVVLFILGFVGLLLIYRKKYLHVPLKQSKLSINISQI